MLGAIVACRSLPSRLRQQATHLVHFHDLVDRDGRATLCRPQVGWRQRSCEGAQQAPRSSCREIFGALRYLQASHWVDSLRVLRKTCVGHSTKHKLYLQDFIAEKAEGTYVWTTDGQKHLDMACGEAWLESLRLIFCFQRCNRFTCLHVAQVSVLSQQAIAILKLSRLYRTKQMISSLLSKTFSRPLLLWYAHSATDFRRLMLLLHLDSLHVLIDTVSGSTGIQAQVENIGGPVRQAGQDSPKRTGHTYFCQQWLRSGGERHKDGTCSHQEDKHHCF